MLKILNLHYLFFFFFKNRFCGDIRKINNSAQANTAQSQTPHRPTLSGVDSAQANTVQSQTFFQK